MYIHGNKQTCVDKMDQVADDVRVLKKPGSLRETRKTKRLLSVATAGYRPKITLGKHVNHPASGQIGAKTAFT